MNYLQKIFLFVVFFCGFSVNAQNLISDSLKSLLLSKHNFYRKSLGAKPLEWSSQLEIIAIDETKKLIASPYNYAPTNLYGENIFRGISFPKPEDILKLWLREQKYYHGEIVNDNSLLVYGHYTQLIWKQTTVMACAMGQTKGGTYIVICLYSPKGNIVGQKP